MLKPPPSLFLLTVGIILRPLNMVNTCEIGLTQMRYQQTLSLMVCTPRLQSEPDPCIEMTGGMNTYCQEDYSGHQYVCCGSNEQLIAILTASIVQIPMMTSDSPTQKITTTKRPPFTTKPTPSFTTKPKATHRPVTVNYDLPINNQSYGYPGLLPSPSNMNWSHLQLQSSPDFIPEERSSSENTIDKTDVVFVPLTTSPPVELPQKRPHVGINPPITLYAGPPVLNGGNKVEAFDENGPLITLLTSARFHPGNITNTWLAPSMAVLLQDGKCSIIVNTGLPVQRNEIMASLATKGISGKTIDYTVITSGHVQFIGNVNLFPASQLYVGMMRAHLTEIAAGNLNFAAMDDLCSENTQIIHTPGPTPDSISIIAKNVPGMGTVAITGALFIEDDRLTRIDRAFVWNERELIESRRKIVCMANWVIPGHSVPIPITSTLKMLANCPIT